MNQCTVPNWNPSHQRQEQVEGEESSRSSHVLNQLQNPSTHLVPMSNHEVAELTWENGQLAMHGLGGLLQPGPTKNTWGRTNETLESIVHQATCHKQNPPSHHLHRESQAKIGSTVASSNGKWTDTASHHRLQMGPLVKKPAPAKSNQPERKVNGGNQDDHVDLSACASAATATFCRDSDATMMTWASFESPNRSLKTKTTCEDSAFHDGGGSENQEEHRETKTETVKSHSSRRSRAAAIHNQSERKRRDRINQKMKALQKLVPNASKTDKASMLDEVIEYLKQLQAQVEMMSLRNMPQMMMMPLAMQQQLQMPFLARMGMGVGLGMGMGMLDMSTVGRGSAPPSFPPLIHPAAPAATFVPPPFIVPPIMPTQGSARSNSDSRVNTSVPLPDPYSAFLAQSMNMELYNKMAAMLYQQQVNQNTQAASSPSQSNHVPGD